MGSDSSLGHLHVTFNRVTTTRILTFLGKINIKFLTFSLWKLRRDEIYHIVKIMTTLIKIDGLLFLVKNKIELLRGSMKPSCVKYVFGILS